MKLTKAFFLSLLSGIFLASAFPPLSLGFCAWFGLIPLLYVIVNSSVKQAFLYSYFSGLIFLNLTLFWLAYHPYIPWYGAFIIIAVIALFYTVPFVLTALLARLSKAFALVIFPFTLAGFEWIRSFDQLAFPWMMIGNSQTFYPGMIQFADITSAYGVSFWVAMINVTVIFSIWRRRPINFISLLLLFVLPIGYSQYVIRTAPEADSSITIGMVQGNVTPEEKWGEGLEMWNIYLYRAMTHETLEYKPDLIIWPETATPVYLADVTPYRRRMQVFVDSIDVPVLTGTPRIDFDTGDTWNSATLFVPGREIPDYYDKIHLVPFGEAIPLDDTIPALKEIDLGEADWKEGTEAVVFDTPGLPPFNALICFESIFPDLVRRFAVGGSEMFVVITNDVWFDSYVSPLQHAMISVLRAIEFKRPIARCANTGISMFIDPYGRIIDRTATEERTTIVAEISPMKVKTFYHRFGNIFSIACFLVSSASLIAYFIMIKRVKDLPLH